MVNHARFDAAALVRELVRCEVTSFCAPPTVWRSIIQLPLDEIKTRLRELASAGEPLNPEVIARVQGAWGLTIRDGYGQTETTAQIGNCSGAGSGSRFHGPCSARISHRAVGYRRECQ